MPLPAPKQVSKIGQRMGKKPGQPGLPSTAAPSNERSYKAGDFLFMEGDSGREMFIIKKGNLKVLKQEGPKMVELATLGAGSVLGEMSLLDNAARSATARAQDEVTAVVIDEKMLDAVLDKVPVWLSSVIKIVVQRLRETTQRKRMDILRNGVVPVLRILACEIKVAGDKSKELSLAIEKVQEAALALFGLSTLDSQAVLEALDFKHVIKLAYSAKGNQVITFTDPDIPELYLDCLFAKWKSLKRPVEEISPGAANMLSLVLEAGAEKGRRQQTMVQLDAKQFELYLQKKEEGAKLPPNFHDYMDELVEKKILNSDSKDVKTANSTYTNQILNYDEVGLRKSLKEYLWTEIFSLDIAEISAV